MYIYISRLYSQHITPHASRISCLVTLISPVILTVVGLEEYCLVWFTKNNYLTQSNRLRSRLRHYITVWTFIVVCCDFCCGMVVIEKQICLSHQQTNQRNVDHQEVKRKKNVRDSLCYKRHQYVSLHDTIRGQKITAY